MKPASGMTDIFLLECKFSVALYRMDIQIIVSCADGRCAFQYDMLFNPKNGMLFSSFKFGK